MTTPQKVRGLRKPARERTEVEALRQAVEDQRTTIRWLEKRGRKKRLRIKELETQIIELGGTPT